MQASLKMANLPPCGKFRQPFQHVAKTGSRAIRSRAAHCWALPCQPIGRAQLNNERRRHRRASSALHLVEIAEVSKLGTALNFFSSTIIVVPHQSLLLLRLKTPHL